MPARSVYAPMLAAVVAAVMLAAVMASPAQADRLDDALKRFAADSYAETFAAVDEISHSGAPNSAAILEALAEGRLFVAADKVVIYKDAGGKVFDARTGRPVVDMPQGLEPVRLNNRVRWAVQAALGSLSGELGKRRASAAALLKSRDGSSLATLEAAIGKASDGSLKSRMQAARAAIILAKPDASSNERVEAIDALAARADQDALAILRNLQANLDPDLKTVAERWRSRRPAG